MMNGVFRAKKHAPRISVSVRDYIHPMTMPSRLTKLVEAECILPCAHACTCIHPSGWGLKYRSTGLLLHSHVDGSPVPDFERKKKNADSILHTACNPKCNSLPPLPRGCSGLKGRISNEGSDLVGMVRDLRDYEVLKIP